MKIDNNKPPIYRVIAVSDLKQQQAINNIKKAAPQPVAEKVTHTASHGEIARQLQINKSLGTKTVFGQGGILISQKRDAKGNILETYPPADILKRYKPES